MKKTFEGEFMDHGPFDGGWSLYTTHGQWRDVIRDQAAEFEGKLVRITIETIEPIILCIFGSRSIKNNVVAYAAIERGVRALGINLKDVSYVLDGKAGGMDNHGHFWARKNGLETQRREAAWKDIEAPGAVVRRGPYGLYNAVAGHWRNEEMAKEGSHFIGVRQAGKSTGTDDMIERVKAHGKILHVEHII